MIARFHPNILKAFFEKSKNGYTLNQIYYHKKLCMKKMILLFAVVAAFSVTGYSQDLLKQATSAATSAAAGGFDVKSLTSSILGKLTPSLGLSDKQKPGVTDAISGFLTKKSDILPLLTSNPASYATKQSGLFNSLKSKLSGILIGNQLNKFLSLKPKTNDPSNLLSHLVY